MLIASAWKCHYYAWNNIIFINHISLHIFFWTTGITKEMKQEEVNRFLKEEYEISDTIPAVFLDNFPDWEDPTEKEMTNQELQTLKDLASIMPPFSCEDAAVLRFPW